MGMAHYVLCYGVECPASTRLRDELFASVDLRWQRNAESVITRFFKQKLEGSNNIAAKRFCRDWKFYANINVQITSGTQPFTVTSFPYRIIVSDPSNLKPLLVRQKVNSQRHRQHGGSYPVVGLPHYQPNRSVNSNTSSTIKAT